MISLNDTHPAPKPVESYRVRKEAMDAAVFVIGPHARHGFEYETSKVDGRWIWRHTDEVRPDTPAEVKTNGGKKSLMLASTPMAHVGAAKPVKLPVPPRRTPPQAQGKPAGAPDGGAGGEQPTSDEMPPCNALTPPIDTIEIVDVIVAGPACNGLDIAKPDGLALPTFLKREIGELSVDKDGMGTLTIGGETLGPARGFPANETFVVTQDSKPAPAKSGTYDELKSEGDLRSEPVAKPVGKPPVSRKAAKAKTAPKPAKRASKANTKTTVASGGNRYDWKGAAEAAKAGKMPKAPDFSADTHKPFRKIMAAVIAAATSGDIKALKAVKVEPKSSSRKIVARYRDLCILALKGQ